MRQAKPLFGLLIKYREKQKLATLKQYAFPANILVGQKAVLYACRPTLRWGKICPPPPPCFLHTVLQNRKSPKAFSSSGVRCQSPERGKSQK